MSSPRFQPVAVRIVLAAACLFASALLPAQDPKPTEYQVKAAYLTNLGRFVSQWSARTGSSDETFDICVLGQDPFGPDLDTAVKGEKIGGSPLAARRVSGPQEAAGCRVLFISGSGDAQMSAALGALGTAPVLTVSDIPDFVKRGGMIQFILDGSHVRFEINITAARRAGLTLSSELLKIARGIRRTP
jgi:YfiR/HmsC-like